MPRRHIAARRRHAAADAYDAICRMIMLFSSPLMLRLITYAAAATPHIYYITPLLYAEMADTPALLPSCRTPTLLRHFITLLIFTISLRYFAAAVLLPPHAAAHADAY